MVQNAPIMSQAITLEQFSLGLSDPNYALGVMIANNPEDIADNLNNMGFNVSTPQNIAEALQVLFDQKDYNGFKNALSVKIKQERMSPEEIAIVTQQCAAFTRAAGGSAKSFDVNAAFAGLATGVLTYLTATGSTVSPAAAAGQQPPKPTQPDNTGMWIGIGIGLLVLVVLVLFVFKKKG